VTGPGAEIFTSQARVQMGLGDVKVDLLVDVEHGQKLGCQRHRHDPTKLEPRDRRKHLAYLQSGRLSQ
jgi:hypothetical protein